MAVNTRLKQLSESLARRRLDAYLVTKDVNIRYLTGFPASESWLLVTPRKSFFITDFRYVLEAQKGLRGIPVKQYRHSLAQGAFEVAQTNRVRILGLDERHISLAGFNTLNKHRPAGIKLAAANGLVEELREIKDRHEIALVRQALKLHHQAYNHLERSLKIGMSELELLRRLEQFVKRHHAGFSFPPIIASGPNSCLPHAKVTERKLKANEPVLIDCGMEINGYKSDLTRIFFLGKIPRLVREVYQHVGVAQQKAIASIASGVKASEVDAQARNYLKSKRLGQYFGHSLGHGVGLEIHEGPRLSSQNHEPLKENMIVTVEPGVYLPGKFGIRIEDMVLVTKKGCEVLSVN